MLFTMTCQIANEDCNEYYAKQFCKFHYNRWYKGAVGEEIGAPKKYQTAKGRTCEFEGCENPMFTKGLCHTHDMQFRARGELWAIGTKTSGFSRKSGQGGVPVQTCMEEGCETLVRRNGRCHLHNAHRLSGIIPRGDSDIPCNFLDCKGIVNGGGVLCPGHRTLSRTYGLSDAELAALAPYGSRCAICDAEVSCLEFGSRPAIDHDHACCSGSKSCGNCVRGLLCTSCNWGLGQFRDNPQYLVNAIGYLSREPIVQELRQQA